MVDAGGPGSVRKCPGVALVDLGDVEEFDRSGKEDQDPRRLHSLVFTGDKWVASADPVQPTVWLIDLKNASAYVVTVKEHKLRKVVNSGTRLCSFIPETRNIIVSKAPDHS